METGEAKAVSPLLTSRRTSIRFALCFVSPQPSPRGDSLRPPQRSVYMTDLRAQFEEHRTALVRQARKYLAWIEEEKTRIQRLLVAANGPDEHPHPYEGLTLHEIIRRKEGGRKTAFWPLKLDEVLKEAGDRGIRVAELTALLLERHPRLRAVKNPPALVRATLVREAGRFGWIKAPIGGHVFWRKEVTGPPKA